MTRVCNQRVTTVMRRHRRASDVVRMRGRPNSSVHRTIGSNPSQNNNENDGELSMMISTLGRNLKYLDSRSKI